MPRTSLALAALLLLSLAPGPAGAGPSGRGGHPATGGDADCAACHEEATPAAFKAWFEGRHGMNLVRCQVCHGSTGADFTRRPVAERCRGCHGAQVDSLARCAVKDCFACHAPHTLSPNPHR